MANSRCETRRSTLTIARWRDATHVCDPSSHNPNVELIAQGIANIVSPLFGGLPATGAIARTATNIRSGARTPVAGTIHALTLIGILLVAAPLARFIPLAVLASILLLVAYTSSRR